MTDIAEQIFEQNYAYIDDCEKNLTLDKRQENANRHKELKPKFKKHVFCSLLSIICGFCFAEAHDKCCEYDALSDIRFSLQAVFICCFFISCCCFIRNISYFLELFITKARSEGNTLPFEKEGF